MVRTCSICSHKDINEINKLLLFGDPYRDIARLFKVDKSALSRHKGRHIPDKLLKADDIKDVVEANDSLATIQKVRGKAFELLDMAIEAADTKVYGAPSQYLREIREQVKLWAELEGRLATQPQINVNTVILQSPEWIALRTKIVNALEPYQDAKEAVIIAING